MYNLCCISNQLREQGYKFQTMTWHRFSQLPRDEAIATVSARTLNNVRVTLKALRHCYRKNWGYRVSSNLFPLLSYKLAELHLPDYPDWADIRATLASCSEIVDAQKVRISCHPDQFNVLASEGKPQVENTIKELNHQGHIMTLLGARHNYWNPINIHVNNTKGDPADIAARFTHNLSRCHRDVTSRLVVENEDKGIWTPKLLAQHFDIPITYDNLHHKCLPDGLTQGQAYDLCYRTWHVGENDFRQIKPIFHYSESHPDKPNPRSHADMPTGKPLMSDVMPADYDIELKGKDYAIEAISA